MVSEWCLSLCVLVTLQKVRTIQIRCLSLQVQDGSPAVGPFQQLIAPSSVKFYTGNWTFSDTTRSLSATTDKTTRNPVPVLEAGDVQIVSIAKRICWAAHWQTTRPEDIAYSLLRIFDVNISLIYSEGRTKPFIWLQEEILKSSLNHSLFAWGFTDSITKSSHGSEPLDFRQIDLLVLRVLCFITPPTENHTLEK